MTEFVGSYDGDDVLDTSDDDILFAGDADFDRSIDAELLAQGDYGAVRRRKVKRQVKRGRELETVLMPFPTTAVNDGSSSTLTVEPDRDCRLLDLRLVALNPTTGARVPTLTVDALSVGGNSLFNAAGTTAVDLFLPEARGTHNCSLKKIIRQSTRISLTVTNFGASDVLVSAALLVRARVTV